MHRKPCGPDATTRWLLLSTINRYPSPSRITPLGQLSDIVLAAALPATVIAFTCPERNFCTRSFPQSATNRFRSISTKIPRGLFNVLEVAPEQSVPAAMVHIVELLFNDFISI